MNDRYITISALLWDSLRSGSALKWMDGTRTYSMTEATQLAKERRRLEGRPQVVLKLTESAYIDTE